MQATLAVDLTSGQRGQAAVPQFSTQYDSDRLTFFSFFISICGGYMNILFDKSEVQKNQS